MEKTQERRPRATDKRRNLSRRNSLVRSARHHENQARTGLARNGKAVRAAHFVLCIDNKGEDDLEARKVYRVLPDELAARHGMIRVIDESGEDYLYLKSMFVPLELPKKVERVLALAN
jgi:hypothetical protein